MNLKHLVLPLLIAVAGSAVAAEPHMTALEAALTDCANKVKKDAEGMPDQNAMAACMKAKGFGGPETEPSAKPKGK